MNTEETRKKGKGGGRVAVFLRPAHGLSVFIRVSSVFIRGSAFFPLSVAPPRPRFARRARRALAVPLQGGGTAIFDGVCGLSPIHAANANGEVGLADYHNHQRRVRTLGTFGSPFFFPGSGRPQ